MSTNDERRVVVTGAGLVTPLGSTKESFWQSLIEGKSGVKKINRLDVSKFKTAIAATIDDFDPEKYIEEEKVKWMDRFTHFAIAAATLALEDSGLDINKEESRKASVILGSAVAGIISHEVAAKDLFTRGHRYVDPLTVLLVMFNAGANNICLRFGFTGVSYGLATACSSGTNAIGEAYLRIKNGIDEIVVAGGADAPISPVCFSAWDKLRVMSKNNDEPERACKPFSKNRDGLVMGEGAGIVVLESLESARKRSAKILCEIKGYGATNDAFHITYPNRDQEVRALNMALADAGIGANEIDYINAHGTGTYANDKVETESIKTVFGEQAPSIPISAIKPMIGHPLGASGAIELITCILVMERGLIPPTINYEVPDPECDLDYVPNVAREANVKTAITNSFAFGGANAILIVRKI